MIEDKIYTIGVTRTLYREVQIQAGNEHDAKEEVHAMFMNHTLTFDVDVDGYDTDYKIVKCE